MVASNRRRHDPHEPTHHSSIPKFDTSEVPLSTATIIGAAIEACAWFDDHIAPARTRSVCDVSARRTEL